ncbi:MAG: hypothetical protein SGI73_13140 [Chloroflexota bacterium]|nr:hypothetical protein [Chloroflexota bacterium]
MSNTIASENFSKGLLVVLTETFEKVNGIYLDRGTSMFETLATISAEEASRPVSATCASLAAQVEHTRFYLDTLEKFVRGENPGEVDWDHIWNTVHAVTSDEWEASKTRLRETYVRIVDMATNYDQWDNDDAIGGAIGMVAHTAYHLGEIRQALCTLKGAR